MSDENFEDWYRSVYAEWTNDNKLELWAAWHLLSETCDEQRIAEAFNEVVYAIRDEYGD